MYILLILLALVVLVVHHFSNRKEGYKDYDETSCLILAKKNQDNIESLKKSVDALLALQSKAQAIEATTEANKTQLKTLVDQVYKSPL
jgi:hypothetical protein